MYYTYVVSICNIFISDEQHWDPSIPGINQSNQAERCIKQWSELQDGQQILITTPSVLLGFRIKVYRAEGTTQWYTAVTTGYNETSSVRYPLYIVAENLETFI